jgi:hypothetical protein
MTLYLGRNIYACPECGARYADGALASVTLFGWRSWSDGHTTSPRGVAKGSVCRCPCGALHLRDEGGRVDFVPEEALSRLRSPSRSFPSFCSVVREEEIPALLRRPCRREVEVALRRERWRALNTPFRNEPPSRGRSMTYYQLLAAERRRLKRFRRRIARHARQRPPRWPQAGPAQRSNLERLVTLLSGQPDSDWLEIGEAQRELGQFAQAITAFGRTEGGALAAFLTRLASAGSGRVARTDNIGGRLF